MAMDIDAILRVIGEFGPYQRTILFLLCIPAILSGCSSLSYVFIAATPKYRCAIPGCDNKTNSAYHAYFNNYTIPYDEKTGEWDQCHQYIRTGNDSKPGTCFADDFSINQTSTCKNGSVFDKSVYLSTIVSEFELTCHDAWETNMAQTVYFGGVLTGSLISGYLADKIGRKLTITIGIVGLAAFGVTTALVSTLDGFNFVRFMSAVMSTAVMQASFILGTELVGPKMRVVCGVVPQYFFAIGEIVLGLVSWWIREWRMIQLLISAPVSCCIFYWFFLPESPRWLQARGKHRKAISVMEKIAKRNKKTIPQDMLMVNDEDVNPSDNDGDDDDVTLLTDRKVSMMDVLRKPILSIRMVFMFYIWIVVSLVYYGLSMNAVVLGGSDDSTSTPFVDFILSSLVEIPGYSLSWLCMCWIGRRFTLSASLILAGISCCGAGFAAEYGAEYVIIPFLFGKCFITCSFATVYMFTMEMFPTSVRSTILGLSSTHARIGAMLAPFSSSLSDVYGPLPMIVFGVLSLVASLLNVVMPETKNTTLPETIADAVNLGRSQTVSVQECGTSEEVQGLLGDEIQDDSEQAILNSDDSNVQEIIQDEDRQ